jgi:hypothetical protein
LLEKTKKLKTEFVYLYKLEEIMFAFIERESQINLKMIPKKEFYGFGKKLPSDGIPHVNKQ